jgi:hypothetical protein
MYTFFLIFIPQTIQYNSYLHASYIALGSINNLEIIWSIWKSVDIYVKILLHFILASWASAHFGDYKES